MKKYTWLLVAAIIFMFMTPVYAAPLFGDVPDEHWARDAVANLAAKGLVEGYPDGTFKGDRAATRYELAMVVARFLAKNDQEHATFATKADLEELRKLVMQLKDELDALGVRVTNLEENVSKLDKRVTELERITFYGEFDSILVTQGFLNQGQDTAEFHPRNTAGYFQWNTFTPGVQLVTIPNSPNVNAGAADGNYLSVFNTSAGIGTWAFVAGVWFNGANNLGQFTNAWNNTVLIGDAYSAGGALAFGNHHVYNQMVGNVGGANINPFFHGVMPVADYRTGRPLTNGTGFSMKGLVGINAKVNDEIDAGLELAAYTSMGDPIVDAFYGVSAPYLTNPFTGNVLYNNGLGGGLLQSQNNNPWTRMVLDNFWVKHKTSGIKLIGGSFGELNMEPLLYAGEPNPNVNGPKYLNNYGFRVFGTCHFLCDMDWEVFWTRLADDDPFRIFNAGTDVFSGPFTFMQEVAPDYLNWAYGVDFNWRFGGGNFKLGLMRAVNDSITGASQFNTNGIWSLGPNAAMGNPYGSLMTNPLGWVNPSGYYFHQLAGGRPDQAAYFVNDPGWMNKSPVFTYVNSTNGVNVVDAHGGVGGATAGNDYVQNDGIWGGYGPQETTNWSAKFSYKWDPSQLRFFMEYGNSSWKPNMNSGFSRTGGAGRVGLGATLAQGKLDLDLTYKAAQAWYDPFTLRYPMFGLGLRQQMWRFPNQSYYPWGYQLHDSDSYPNNRRGWKFKVTYRFPDEKGKVWAFYEGLDQDTTSVYDVRYFPGAVSGVAANNLVPNAFVFGYTPGFIDPVFTPYAMSTYYGWNANNPQNVANWAAPLEDPRGKVNQWAIGADYKFPESGFVIDASYYDTRFNRPTGLAINGLYNLGSGLYNVGAGPSANNIDLSQRGFHIGLQYPFNERFTGRIGYDYQNIVGHYDPNNIFWLHALQTGSSSFTNVDTQQSIPYLGFDYKINKNTEWGLNVQFFTTVDRIGSSLQPTLDVTSGNFDPQNTWRDTNPFSWNGIQIMTEFKVKF